MDSIVNTPEHEALVTRISLDELNTKSTSYDSALNYSYGVLTLFSKSFACIKPAFYNYDCEQRIEYDHSETVIFDSSTALIRGVDGKVNALKNVYLVRYVAGGTALNAKTGETQPTIDYSAPVEILLSHSKKQCIFLAIEDGFAVMNVAAYSEKVGTSEPASSAIKKLDEKALTDLRAIIDNEIKKQGFAYSSEFPRYLYEVCETKDVRLYASGVSEFIKVYLADTFQYEANYSLKGKKIPGVILPVRKAKKSAQVRIIEETRINFESLSDELHIDLKATNYQVGVVSYCNKWTAFINPGFGVAEINEDGVSVIFNPSLIKTVPEQFVFNTKNNIYLVLFSVSGTVINTKTGVEHPAIDSSLPIRIIREIPRKDCAYINIRQNEITIGGTKKQEKPVLSEDKRETIFLAIRERILNNKGTVKPTEIPKILDSLQDYGVSKNIYQGEQLQSWIKTNFPELFVSPSTHGGGHEYIYLWKVTPEDIEIVALTDFDVDRVRNVLIGYLLDNSSVALADISRKVFMPNGLDIRFYPIGRPIEEWLLEQEQFTFSDDKLSIRLSKDCVEQFQAPDSVPLPVNNTFTDLDAEELEHKFANSQYVEFLSSDCFRRLKPTEIPVSYMEKALTAARRIIFGFDAEEVQLNAFQRSLLMAANNSDLSEWTSDARYNDGIIELCLETMMFNGTKPNAAKMLNELIHKSSRADQYLDSNSKKTKGLVSRFQIARNEHTLPLYVIAAFAQDNPSNIKTIIVDYCRFVQEINDEALFLANNRGLSRALYFSSILKAILLAPCAHEITLENATQTLILSVFVDTYSVETLDENLVSILFPDEDGYHRSLISLIKRHESWKEEEFVNFIAKSPSLQLLERSTALILGKLIENSHCDDVEQFSLPGSFLRLLSWLISYCDRATLEAVIDFPTIVNEKKIPRKAKCLMMLRSLPIVQELTGKESVCYNLGTYLSNYLFEEAEELGSSDLIAQDIPRFVSEWIAFSQRRFEAKKHALSTVTADRKTMYAELFKEYWIDKDRELLLQQMYADELLSRDLQITTEPENILLECLSLQAYGAYCRLYQRTQIEGKVSLNENYRDGYVNGLIQIEDFKKLIDYVLSDLSLDDEAKKRYLTKAVCGVFGSFHYSTKSFAFFDEKFTLDDARMLLQEQIATNNFPVITSLIAIYIHQSDYFKARYLYEIFHSRAEIGNTRIYLQFKRLFDSKTNHILQTGSEDNHYNVLQTAFYALAPQSLIQFLSWASGIKIPDMANYNPQHVHILAMSNFLKDPSNTMYWQKFIQALSTRLTQYPVNAWLVCVCDGVLSSVWNLEHNFDVRRAYELVLTQIQDSNIRARYFPVGLMPYIVSYIIRKDDEQLCRSLRTVVADEQLWSRLFVHNPWAKEYKDSLSAFSDYCVRKLKETSDELYSDLLKTTAPSVSIDNLSAIVSVSGNADYLIRQICNNYLEGIQISETQSIISQIDLASLSFRDKEAIELLQTIYTDEMEMVEQYPDLFADEEKVYSFKQDCARILQYYPAMDGLRTFETNFTDNRYKRLVYSYVFGVFYNKELYDKYSFDYNAFKHRIDQVIIARFLRKVFYAQLVYNTSYDFFYKRWRYLKLYIAMVIEAGGPVDASEIIDVMKAHHHDDSVLDEFFIPFKQAVDTYYELDAVDTEEKKIFLYCIMLGNFSEYLSDYTTTLMSLTEDETKPMKQIVSLLDYRDVSYAIYDYYDDDIKAGLFQQAKGVASALVPTTFDVLCELEVAHDASAAYRVYKSILDKTPSQCVKAMILLDDGQYHDYHGLIDPLICSRQFPFQIYKRFRLLVLNKNERKSFERYSTLCRYLEEKIDRNAPAVFLYLETLQAANDGNREKAQILLNKIGNGYSQIPSSWMEEAIKLRRYAVGELNEFHANRNLLDASTGGTHVNESYHFCIMLIKRFGSEKLTEKLTSDEVLAAWRCYRDESGSVSEIDRIIAGAQVLRKPKLFAELTKGLGMSETPDKLALDLGMRVLQAKDVLSIDADDQLEIAAELVEHNLDGEIVFPQFVSLLRSASCSIDCWCKHRKTIRKVVDETGYISDDTFLNLYTEILDPCAVILDKLGNHQYSIEELYLDLLGYIEKLSAMEESIFRRLLYSAIERRLSEIRNGVRLVITVENNNNITDGYLYFSIENIGNQSVASTDYEIQIQGLRCELEKSFDMLYPRYIVGGRTKLTTASDTGVTIQVMYSGIVLSRVFTNKDNILFKRIQEIEIKGYDLYNVQRAVQVFGRELQMNELHELIEDESKALIYGPSRIGKTSILDLVREKLATEKGNVIAVTFAGEGSAKLSDYEEIPENVSSGEIEEHLLVASVIKAFNEKRNRLQLPQSFLKDADAEICAILQRDKSIPIRYGMLNDYLEEHDWELWLILDEFQQIVTRWTPEETGAFASICADMNSESRIKLILCGSDDLLKHMVLKKSSIWRRILPPDPYGVQVKALDEIPFKQMLKTETLRSHRSVEDVGLSYSTESLDALYRYTGGVPLYGKQICNQVLKNLRTGGEFQERSTIYTADVALAAQILIREQSIDISGDIYAIYDAVTKGLDKSTDELFLSYIAQYMMNQRVIGCPYSAFTQNPKGAFKFEIDGEEPYKVLDDSLAIAEARGIIKKVDPKASDPCYTFCTIFYYSAFLGTANADRYLEDKLFSQEDIEIVEKYNVVNDDNFSVDEKLLMYFSNQPPLRQAQLLGGLLPIVHDSAKKNVRKIIGDVFGGDKYHQEVHINAQTINTAFTTLLSPSVSSEGFLAAFDALPKLASYLGEEQRERIKIGSQNLLAEYGAYETCFDEQGNCIDEPRCDEIESQILIQENELETLSAPAEQRLLSDTVGAVVNSEDFMTLSEQRWQELLGLRDAASVAKLKALPSEFVAPLNFAVVLHNVFDNVCKKAATHIDKDRDLIKDLDYCPVAIMYCKIVEAMLKQGHTPLYIRGLGQKTLKNGGETTFEDLGTPEEFDASNKDLSIGSFVSHLVYLPKWKFSLDTPQQKPKPNDFWFTAKFKGETINFTDNIRCLIGDEYMEDEMLPRWKSHARALKVIHEIRNRSAHEAVSITKENFDWLIEVLFKQGELLKIWELAEKGIC